MRRDYRMADMEGMALSVLNVLQPIKKLCLWRRIVLGAIVLLGIFSAVNLFLAALRIR